MHFVKLNLAVTLTPCTLLEGQFGLPKLHIYLVALSPSSR